MIKQLYKNRIEAFPDHIQNKNYQDAAQILVKALNAGMDIEALYKQTGKTDLSGMYIAMGEHATSTIIFKCVFKSDSLDLSGLRLVI